MILVNLLENEPKPVDKARRLVLLAFPFFVGLVAVASWPTAQAPAPATAVVDSIRPATPEEKETVVESLGRLPGYYQRLDKMSAHIIDELVFDRASLQIKVQKANHVELREDALVVSEGFFKTDPRSQAQALSRAISPESPELRNVIAPDLAIKGE